MPQNAQSALDKSVDLYRTVNDSTTAEAGMADRAIQAALATQNFPAMVANQGKNNPPQSEIEHDLNTLDSAQLKAKYGDAQANEILKQFSAAQGRYISDKAAIRSLPATAVDNVTGAIGGLGSGVLGIAGFGTGLVAPNAGAHIANWGNEFGAWVDEHQTDALNAHREAQAADDFYNRQIDAAKHAQDLANGHSPFVAGMISLGRSIRTGAKSTLADPMLLEQSVVEQAGQFALTAALTGGLGAAAETLAPGVKAAGVLSESEAAAAQAEALATKAGVGAEAALPLTETEQANAYTNALTKNLSAAHDAFMAGAPKYVNPMIANGIQMGGGAYQQTVANVLNRSHQDLLNSSETYRNVYQQNLMNGLPDDQAQEQAKFETAGRAARQSALIEGSIAALTAPIAHVKDAPLEALGTPTKALVNTAVGEPLQMGLQMAGNQYAVNQGIRNVVDPNQSLSDGVAEEAGKGAVLGGVTTGAMAAGNLALRGPVAAVRGTAKVAAWAFQKSADRASSRAAETLSEANQESPVSAEKLQTVADTIQANAQHDAETIAEDSHDAEWAKTYVDHFMEAMNFDPTELSPDAHIQDVIGDASNKPQAIFNLSEAIPKETDPDKKMDMAVHLDSLLGEMSVFARLPPEVIDAMPEDSEGIHIMRAYQGLAAQIENTPEIREAFKEIRSGFTNHSNQEEQTPITAEEVGTPEGRNKANEAVLRARLAPETGNLDVLNSVLEHREQLGLSEDHVENLMAAKALLESLKMGETPGGKVSQEVLTGKGDEETKKPSALKFMNNIQAALKSGDTERAKNLLNEMGLLAQHMKNKVNALNQHIELGTNARAVEYNQLLPRTAAGDESGLRSWGKSPEGMAVRLFGKGGNLESPTNSIENAQNVHSDQAALTHVYNGLVDAYPQLQGRKIEPSDLHPAIADGSPADLARQFKSGERKVADFSEAFHQQREARQQQQQEQPQQQSPATSTTPEPLQTQETEHQNNLSQQENNDHLDNQVNTDQVQSVQETPEATQSAAQSTAKPAEESVPVHDKTPLTIDNIDKQESSPAPAAENTEALSSTSSSNSKARSVRKLFPNLISITGKITNYLHLSFALRKGDEPATRIQGEAAPINKIRETLSSPESFKSALGASVKKTLTEPLIEAYQFFLSDHVPTADAHERILAGSLKADEVEQMMNFGGIAYTMRANVENFLKAKYSKTSDQTNLDYLLNGEQTKAGKTINRFASGKTLNLLEGYDDGQGGKFYTYNTHLLQSAVMAGLHWFLTVGHTTPMMRDDDIVSLTGSSLDELGPDVDLDVLRHSSSTKDVKDGISNAIRQFWGLQATKGADKSYADGIVEATAAEVMRAMSALGMIEGSQIKLAEDNVPLRWQPMNAETFPRMAQLLERTAAYPGALADAVVTRPEQVHYFGEDKAEVPETQMGSSTLNNSRQKTAVEAANKTIYKANVPGWNLYHAMGSGNLLDLFGGGKDSTESNTNKADLKTRKGMNTTFSTAAQYLDGLMAQMNNRSVATGEAVRDIAMRFGHNMSRVGRLHMLGSMNPQASKLVREILLPTWTNMDMSDPKRMLAFKLATAQALGLKVEKVSPEVNQANADYLLNTHLKPVMDLLGAWIRHQGDSLHELPQSQLGETSASPVHLDGARLTDLIRQAVANSKGDPKGELGAPTPLMLHSLLENARLASLDPEEQSNFRTGLYLEADGKTNGPINAMVMFGSDFFNANWISNVRKGGLKLGAKFEYDTDGNRRVVGTPLHALSKNDLVDLYATTAAKAEGFMQAAIQRMRGSTFDDRQSSKGEQENSQHVDSLQRLAKQFLSGVSEGKDKYGNTFLQLARSLAKNPLTITLYGSGQLGIASNLTNDLLGNLYANMTDALRRKQADNSLTHAQAMFPNDENAEHTYKQLVQDLNQVFSKQLVHVAERPGNSGYYFVSDSRLDPNTGDYVKIKHKFLNGLDLNNWEATPDNFKALQTSMRAFMVEPLSEAIFETVGHDVMAASAVVQKATNLHSIVYSEAIQSAFKKALADRAANDPTYRVGDFLSQEQIDKAVDSVKHLAPLLKTDEQNLLITKKAVYTAKDLKFNRALDGTLGTPPDVDMPGPAGVAGTPAAVLGFGDGNMIQRILNRVHDRIMPVFDGLHMPLDKIDEISQIANQSAMEVWQHSNPVKTVRDTFFELMKQQDSIHQLLTEQHTQALASGKLYEDQPLLAQLLKSPLTTEAQIKELLTADENHNALVNRTLRDFKYTADTLNWTATMVEGRQAILREVGMSSDQMASAAAPFHDGMTALPEGMSDLNTADWLNDRLSKKLADMKMPEVPEITDHAEYKSPDPSVKSSSEKELPNTAVSEDTTPSDVSGTQSSSEDKPETLTPVDQEPNAGTQSDGVKPVKNTPINPLDEKVAKANRALVKGLGQAVEGGVRVLDPASIKTLVSRLKVTPELRTILAHLLSKDQLSDIKVAIGDHEQIRKYATETMRRDYIGEANQNGWGNQGQLRGMYHEGTRTVYLINPSAETLAHELIHAATMDKVNAYFGGAQVHPEVSQAISNIMNLMQQFRRSSRDAKLWQDNPELLKNANQLRDVINNYMRQKDAASAVNEFMAWGLTNQDLVKGLKQMKTSFIPRVITDLVQSIKTLVLGKKSTIQLNNAWDTLRFNTMHIANTPLSVGDAYNESTVLHHEVDQNSRIANIRTHIGQILRNEFDREAESIVRERGGNVLVERAKEAAKLRTKFNAVYTDSTTKAQAAFRDMSFNESMTFSMLNGMFQTVHSIDPNVLNRAQEHYNNVLKNIKDFTVFMDPRIKEGTPEWDVEANEAQAKFNLLLGMNNEGPIVPTFLALAATSESFREILSRIETPQIEKDKSGTLNALIDNTANKLMSYLSSVLAGDRKASNTREALDALMDHALKNALDERTLLEMGDDKFNRGTNYANDRLVQLLTYASDKGQKLGERISDRDSKFAQNAGTVVSLLSSLASSKNSKLASDTLIQQLNSAPKLWKSLHLLAVEIVGRTTSNSNVYDLIKVVKTTAQQIRQNYRNQVPELLDKKFSQSLSDDMQTHVFHAWAKSDFTSVMNSVSAEDAMKLFTDPAARQRYITGLQDQIRKEDPANFNLYEKKMRELARYMMTRKTSPNQLRNAEAISRLFMEKDVQYQKEHWQKGQLVQRQALNPSPEMVRAIDDLTSLYALDHLSADRKAAVDDLIKQEPEGSKFMLNYLHNTRKNEYDKVQDQLISNNYYKGYIRREAEQGTSVKIADDADFGILRQLGYTRVGDFKGSSLDPIKGSRGYYFAPLGARMAFSQGMMQNIDHTVNGIDSTWGFSQHTNGGRITDPTEVERIAKYMHLEKADGEHLMPVFNEHGQVYAFERALDPKMVDMRSYNENLSQMLGAWRGRQIEEHMSTQINHSLIDVLYKNWEEGSNPGSPMGDRRHEYVNLFDKEQTDAVQKDAIRLFNADTQDYIKSTFGKNKFMVRKDLVDQVIGFRQPSLGDMWTGTTKWSPEVQKTVRNALTSFLGIDAYKRVMQTEQVVQGFVSDMKHNMIVKSLTVPAQIMIDNVRQLIQRGVPLASIVKGVGSKLNEIHLYEQFRKQEISLEAERDASTSPVETHKIEARLASIRESYQRMSIWPLLQRGELATIGELEDNNETKLSSGRVSEFLEGQISKLPPALRTPLQYMIVARDTSLYKGLERMMEYGDFIAKGIYYDDMLKKGVKQKEALGRISEEYVNFDWKSSRTRMALDNYGLTWMLNYKLRIAKIALSMVQENPLQSLLTSVTPGLRETGSVIQDNIFSKAISGHLGYSIGPQNSLRGINAGPFWSLTH